MRHIVFSIMVLSALYANQFEIELLTKRYLGKKYVWGGAGPKGFDCSGYTQYIYKIIGISLPRTAYEQSKVGKTVPFQKLQKGDLLFFLTDRKRGIPVTHVGIYLGNGKFIHAASKNQGVVISRLSNYMRYFVTAKRVLENSKDLRYTDYFKRALVSQTRVTTNYGFRYKLIDGKYKELK